MNEHRSRVTFALLVLIVYLFCALAGAVLAAVVGGYILAGVYAAADYNMSTCVYALSPYLVHRLTALSSWIPMIYALIQSLVGLLGYANLTPTIVTCLYIISDFGRRSST